MKISTPSIELYHSHPNKAKEIDLYNASLKLSTLVYCSPCEERDCPHPHLYRCDAGAGAAHHLLHPPRQHPGPPGFPDPALPRQADRPDPRHQVATGGPECECSVLWLCRFLVPELELGTVQEETTVTHTRPTS